MKINDSLRIMGILSVSVLAVVLLMAPAASQDIPDGVRELPMALYGSIQVNDQPAPPDTVVAAYVGHTWLGDIQVEVAGQYGDEHDPLNRLVVNEPLGADDLIHIYIQTPSMSTAVEAQQTIEWDSDAVKQLDLTAVYVEGSTGGKDISGSGGYIGTSTADATATAIAGGAGEAAPDSTSAGTTTSEAEPSQIDKPLSPVVIIALLAIIGIAAFAIYKKLQ